jgi:hypothetical protein
MSEKVSPFMPSRGRILVNVVRTFECLNRLNSILGGSLCSHFYLRTIHLSIYGLPAFADLPRFEHHLRTGLASMITMMRLGHP